jgi:hypothetical protein
MKTSPFHPGPLETLTQEALSDLRRIKNGESITTGQYVRLEIDDLIRPGLKGWMLTDVGQYRLEKGQ